jgi:DNA modification methylase
MEEEEGKIWIMKARSALKFMEDAPNATTAVLDPWYNRGVGGEIEFEEYHQWLKKVVNATAEKVENMFVWGFPDIIYRVLDYIPDGFELAQNGWLTWYYKNCPTRSGQWRPSQNACLHLRKVGAQVHPEHFMNEKQMELKRLGKLQYMPGPTSVMEVALLVGFVGKKEQTGHPSQKPEKTIEPLIKMTTVEGDLVLDPFGGSGTTAAVCKRLKRNCLISDSDSDYIELMAKRLSCKPRVRWPKL